MLALNLSPVPVWIDLMPGVRVHLRPMCSAFLLRARMEPVLDECPDAASHSLALSKAVFDSAVIAWEGIGDDDGNVIEPSPAAISALLDMKTPYDVFCEKYFNPWLAADAEKNGSAPSLNGTSAAAQTIAVPATDSVQPARAAKTRRKR